MLRSSPALRSTRPNLLVTRQCWRRRLVFSRYYSDSTAATAPVSTPTKVEKILIDNVKATGAFSFATYMALCLSHPTDGYYMNPRHPVFGSKGDFVTSPEISQVFGELIAIWLLSNWVRAGRPPQLRLVELGPGRGTLMDDVIRVISKFAPSALQSVHMIETSPTMRELQKAKLGPRAQKEGLELKWHDVIEDVEPSSDQYTMLFAHEFFDALPIHILQKSEKEWREVLIATEAEPIPEVSSEDDNGSPTRTEKTRLQRVLSSKSSATAKLLGSSSPRYDDIPVGSTLEVSPQSFRTARNIGEIISPTKNTGQGVGGCALIIDYGGDRAHTDSFRAFKDHEIVDVFHRPGECDLTANVDFAYLKEALADIAVTHGPLDQGVFLDRMGMQIRVEGLKQAAISEDRKKGIEESTRRLVDPLSMGKEYKVMGITSRDPTGTQASEVWPFVEDMGIPQPPQ